MKEKSAECYEVTIYVTKAMKKVKDTIYKDTLDEAMNEVNNVKNVCVVQLLKKNPDMPNLWFWNYGDFNKTFNK